MERVGFYARVGACLVDLFLLALFSHLAMAADVLFARGVYSVPFRFAFGTITWGTIAILVVLGIALETLGNGTVGKRVLGLVILGEAGEPVGTPARFRRSGMKFAPLVFIFFPVAAFAPIFDVDNGYGLPDVIHDSLRLMGWVDVAFWAAVSAFVLTGCFAVRWPARQAFHDRFAGTAVYRRQDLPGRAFVPTLKRADLVVKPEEDAKKE